MPHTVLQVGTAPLEVFTWNRSKVRSHDRVIARRHFFAYGDPSDIPWQTAALMRFDILNIILHLHAPAAESLICKYLPG